MEQNPIRTAEALITDTVAIATIGGAMATSLHILLMGPRCRDKCVYVQIGVIGTLRLFG